MMLARLDTFVQELEGESLITSSVESLKLYYFFDGKWFEQRSRSEVSDAQLIERLNQTRNHKLKHWRARRSGTCFFRINDLDAVIVGQFASPPRIRTSTRFSDAITRCLTNSHNAFAASHNKLTGLLAKEDFQRAVEGALISRGTTGPSGPKAVAEVPAIYTVSVFALDLDNFKQVNDTFGHRYGDIVLKCFGRRLEQTARECESKYSGKARIVVGHPSGEEFNVLVAGIFSNTDLFSIAEQFRKRIADQLLPTEAEWEYFKGVSIENFSLPASSSRYVTTSIGIATSQAPIIDGSNQVQSALNLLNQSDIALYKAKSGGRNTVRHFSDILQRYGTVLEHRLDVGILTIDIGRKVNVAPGQEFLIYHPDFTGSTPYIQSDGRTKKSLGFYPRVPIGRIVVFDVQQDVAFCKTADEKQRQVQFPPGSVLEAVPVGSIAHLISDGLTFVPIGRGGPNLVPADQLPLSVKAIVDKKALPFVAVFKIQNAGELLEQMGIAFVNQWLAAMYNAIRDEFSSLAIVGQIESTQFAVVVEMTNADQLLRSVGKVISKIRSGSSNVVKLIAGIFRAPKGKDAEAAKRQKLKVDKSLDFARYAVSQEGFPEGAETEVFSIVTASRVLESWRKKQLYSQALVDYQKLKDLGVEASMFENQAGLLAYSMGDLNLAAAYFKNATELEPTDPVLFGNLGIIVYLTADRATAWEHFKQADTIDKNWLPRTYEAARALSMYAAFRTKRESVNRADLLAALKQARDRVKESSWVSAEELDQAISTLAIGDCS